VRAVEEEAEGRKERRRKNEFLNSEIFLKIINDITFNKMIQF